MHVCGIVRMITEEHACVIEGLWRCIRAFWHRKSTEQGMLKHRGACGGGFRHAWSGCEQAKKVNNRAGTRVGMTDISGTGGGPMNADGCGGAGGTQ